ncbi:Zinc finger, CCCH-type [Sesbania bispinosa]|nr:Zinc finger, CCCH-type [Sesbania bispinosa]
MEQPQPETAVSLGTPELAAAELLSRGVRDLEESRLVGVPVALACDVDMAEREGGCCAPNLEVAVVDGAILKRKRGRPAKGTPKTTPPPRQKKDEEDVCFICFDGGSLVLCDRRGCPKAYHPSCIKRDEEFFRSKAKWNCGWHICSTCQRASHYMCYTCTFSLCKGCTKDADFVLIRGNKGLCGICMRTIMLIENSAQGNKEMCDVDFDDKSSWEYLFKVYWMYLKGKLSLTFDELLRAKNPFNGAAPMSCKVQTPHELYHLKDDKGSGSENSCIDIESNNLKNKKYKRQPKLLSKGDCFDRITSAGDTGVSLPECMKWASKELLEFVAHMKNGDTSLLSQFDVQSLLQDYVKKNNLRDPEQKSQIVCDSRLVNLFGKARVGYIEMLMLLEPHFLIKYNSRAENAFGAGIIDAVANEGEAIDNYNKQLMSVNDKRCITSKKADVLVPQNNPDAYAAINAHNINLIYLRRSLMESLMDDTEKIEKVVGSFVRIRISSGDQKQDMYRLVQVVGTNKVAEPYKIGTSTTDIKLEILNLNRKEVISIDEISNQEFSEDECKRLRQSIKYGLSKRLTVGEILDKALTLQAIRANDLSRKCLPHGNHDYVCAAGNIRSKYPGFDRREMEPIFSRIWDGVLNDVGCRTQDLTTTRDPIANTCTVKNHINHNDTAIDDSTNVVKKSEASSVAVGISSSPLSMGIEQPFNDYMNDKSWHYQDPTGKVQGPFSMLQLYKWNESGHFPPDLRIWRMDEKQDNSTLLSDALNGKCSKNVTLPSNSQLLSLGPSVTLDNKESSQDGGRNAIRNEICADSQIIEQNREQKVDDTSNQSNGKDESVRSNGWNDQLHVYPLLPQTAFSEKLNENPSDKLREGHGIEGNSKDNGNYGSNRTSDGQSNSGQSYQKQSDSEDNSGQSSGQNWIRSNVNINININSPSNCLVTPPAHVSETKASPLRLGFDLHNPPSPPVCNTTWQAIIGEPDDFDESVSDLLAEVEAMESLGGLESPTSIMKRGEELTGGSKNVCLSFAELSPMLDAGNQWESGSENSIVPSTVTLGMAIDTTWRLGSENTHLGWGGMDQRNTNMGWGVGQTAVPENRSSNSYTSVVTPGFGDSQTRYSSDRFSVPRDRGFPGHGRESNFSRGRTAWNRQPLFGAGNGGSYRPLPKGQRVCKFYESGYCKKGASCDYLHP